MWVLTTELIPILQKKACANCRTYRSFCLNLRTFQICMPITGLIARLPASTWGLSGGLHTNCRIYHGCASAEDLRTWTPTWGHYQGWPVTWPGCHESHVENTCSSLYFQHIQQQVEVSPASPCSLQAPRALRALRDSWWSLQFITTWLTSYLNLLSTNTSTQ